MDARLAASVRSRNPDLLDWSGVTTRTLKDPKRPLSVVSDLGVLHAGLEEGSAVYRLSDGARSVIVKQHYDTSAFRREVANTAFVNMVGPIAPEVVDADEQTGAIVMEDLGDRSLAYLWKNERWEEYRSWVYETVEIVVRVQAYFQRDGERLQALYGDMPVNTPR